MPPAAWQKWSKKSLKTPKPFKHTNAKVGALTARLRARGLNHLLPLFLLARHKLTHLFDGVAPRQQAGILHALLHGRIRQHLIECGIEFGLDGFWRTARRAQIVHR